MRIFQVLTEGGVTRLGVEIAGGTLVLKEAHGGVATGLDLLEAHADRGVDPGRWADAARSAGRLVEVAREAPAGPAGRLTVPVRPPEVWGAGVTYRRSAEFREEGSGIYDRVYDAERPELFFKATPGRCSGPGEPIGRRRDSAFTASEPEVALVVSSRGAILGYTLANDVSAWDIERENPLYLPQSKVYDRCFAFGPVIVTPDEISDPYALALSLRVSRGGREVFRGEASTAQLKRRFEDLVAWLIRSNPISTGTVLSTGTGIIQPLDAGLEEGDVVTISCPQIGELANPVALV
jgi:2-dehydro-3-deoxy-D-arabinonate dehydratase